jgi:hypothetical protein
MPSEKGDRPLKVCQTCRYWSYRYKGFCSRLDQGVGRFWSCVAWVEAEEAPSREAPGRPAPRP